MALWYEHTPGAGPSGCKLDEQWVWKRSTVMTASQITDELTDQTYRTITNKIPTSGLAVTVYNSLNWSRTDFVTVSTENFPKYYDIIDRTSGEAVKYRQYDDNSICFTAENIPSNGYKVYDVMAICLVGSLSCLLLAGLD